MLDSTQLESWYESPKGAYVLNAQLALIRSMIASWKRRDHLVLDMGTGAGHILTTLWECGFDITGVEDNPDLFDKVQARLGNKVVIHRHNPEHLPYDDNTFDYVILSSILLTQRPIEPLLAEAFRLASKGIVLFWKNSISCHGLLNLPVRTFEGQAYRLQEYSSIKIWRDVHKHCPQCSCKLRSILFGPSYTWQHIPYIFAWNALATPVPLGAFACLRIDRGISLPLTSTPLLTRNQNLAGACTTD